MSDYTPETLQRTMQEKDLEVAQLKEQIKGIEIGRELVKKLRDFEAETHLEASSEPLGVYTDGEVISPLVKKRTLKDECAIFQAKKIKQEDCNSNEEMIIQLQEKVARQESALARQETTLCELQQEIRLLQQHVNTVNENHVFPSTEVTKAMETEEEPHEQRILHSLKSKFTLAMESSLLPVADDLYSHNLIDEHTKTQAVAMQTTMSAHQRCSQLMDILITTMGCIDGDLRRQTFIGLLNVFKKYVPLRYVAVKAQEEYASLR